MKQLLSVAILGVVLAGCESEPEKPSGMRERQERALNDPFGYSPHDDRSDISGGGLMEFKKDAFKKDMDSVFSP